MSNVARTALYYPSFHMEVDWAKSSLLYWDRLCRIVPQTIENTVDAGMPEIERLAGKEIVESIDPNLYKDEAAARFRPFLDRFVNGGRDVLLDDEFVRSMTDGPWRLHSSKIADTIRPKIENFAFDISEDEMIRMPAELGAPYMLCLSRVMHEHLRLPLITDSPKSEQLANYFSFSGESQPQAGSFDDTRHALMQVGIPMPSPRQLRHVEVEDILRFRERREAERMKLIESASQLVREGAEIEDENRLRLFWQERKKDVAADVETLKRLMRPLGVTAFDGLIHIGIPASISESINSTEWMPDGLKPVAGILVLLTSLAGWWGKYKFYRLREYNKSTWQYALAVRDKFQRPN